MSTRPTAARPVAIAFAVALGAAVQAEPISASSASSASSQSVSASVGSISNSITGSSNASSGTAQQTADGDYRITEVAALDARPGDLRLRLEPVDPARGADAGFYLHLPRATYEKAGIGEGQVISARTQPYGLAFGRPQARDAFFLVVADEWLRELQTHAVSL